MSVFLSTGFPGCPERRQNYDIYGSLASRRLLDAEYRPHDGYNATLMAFIADSIAAICNISRQWKIFGDYWHLNNMRQLLDVKNRRGSKADKEDVIISIFKKVAEADDNIRNTDAYRS